MLFICYNLLNSVFRNFLDEYFCYIVFFFLSLSFFFIFFFQAEDGIRDFCLSRGLGDVYKRQEILCGWIKLSRDRSANGQECEHGIKGDTAELHAYV